MTGSMQKRFKSLAKDRGFWHNETTATHQDLAGLFVARAVERYLKSGGRLAFVVPNSVVDRDYWRGFRQGRFDGANVAFGISWDLRRIRPHLFPRGSAVIFGSRGAREGRMPSAALIWAGRAPHRHANIDTASQLTQTMGELSLGSIDDARSPYAARFVNGANLVPRLMFRVEPAATTALGVPGGRAAVKSKRSASEKIPWKRLPDITGTVESEFLWPTILGEQIIPFRMLSPEQFLIPLTQKGDLLSGDHPRIDAYPGLAAWVRNAEELWAEHGVSKMTLAGQIDHMKKLSQQIPLPALRVAYAKSGMHVSATLVTNPRAIIENTAYWATVSTSAEGHYLVGILNSPSLTELVRPLMSYGKDERHIDKHVWKLPIPIYDPADELHIEISRCARDLAQDIASHTFRSANFVTTRKDLRAHLAASDLGQRLDMLVARLLGVDAPIVPGPAPSGPGELIRTTSSSLNLEPADVEIDVDCEFDQEGRVYLWGALLTRGGADSAYQAFGSLKEAEAEVTAQFAEWLREQVDDAAQNGSSLRWFHYGRVETLHLERILGTSAAPLLTAATDLLDDVIRPHFYSPAGYGLKRLAPLAGATWRTEGATGADTYEWLASARTGDQAAWTRLLDYNEDDTRATRALREHLRKDDSAGP